MELTCIYIAPLEVCGLPLSQHGTAYSQIDRSIGQSRVDACMGKGVPVSTL